MTNPHEIRKVLNHYVRTVLCTENPPDPDDRAYFPVHRDLKNHIYKAKLALELSKFDQHNVVKKISEWKTTYPDSRHFFVHTFQTLSRVTAMMKKTQMNLNRP